jgi:hypothetical protein
MPEPRPFSIRMFIADGSADGLRILTKSNWIGCGVVCPRALLPEAKSRDEFSRPGVYIHVGPAEEGDLPTIYVGQGDVVRPRLEKHFVQKDFWTWAVFFTASDGSLTSAHVRYLEARLVDLALEAKRARLDNGNSPGRPALSEADEADAEGFLSDLLSILPLVGLYAFEKPRRATVRRETLYVKARGVRAQGEDAAGGFVVLKGSQASASEVPSIHAYLIGLRRDLVAQGVLVPDGENLRFTQDYTFTSPSTAAGVILGRSANGRIEWQDRAGRTLKSIQEASVPAPVPETA